MLTPSRPAGARGLKRDFLVSRKTLDSMSRPAGARGLKHARGDLMRAPIESRAPQGRVD